MMGYGKSRAMGNREVKEAPQVPTVVWGTTQDLTSERVTEVVEAWDVS